ncbi:SubName: Full=Uncharacterized protein {ECO:0000313/EMBL:CCA73089.1} [Serendipita indica DSM 11827]|nr:SubName: Full=Uncharacterized protein {ECO:0000313/EMBL:CCA73089.1} [Serendipita indica DSM 11827]
MPSALILIANGTEEMEFTIPYDTLVRAGIDCTSAFVPSESEVGLAYAGGWGINDVTYSAGKLVGMICAGSLAAKTSKLPSQPLTSHPSVKKDLESSFEYKEDSVVVSGSLITSRGPGTAFPFAFKIVELLCGEAKVKEVRSPMIFPAGVF